MWDSKGQKEKVISWQNNENIIKVSAEKYDCEGQKWRGTLSTDWC